MYSRAPRRSWHTYMYAHAHTQTRTHRLSQSWLSEEPLTLILSLAYFCPQKENSSALHHRCYSHTLSFTLAVTIHISHTHTHTVWSNMFLHNRSNSLRFIGFIPRFLVVFENHHVTVCPCFLSALYWAVVIKIHYVPLGCRGQFVSSALIWQHFNPTGDKLGNSFIWHVKKKKKWTERN